MKKREKVTQTNPKSRKPRIRKAPLTKREQAELAKSKASNEKPRRVRKAVSTASKPLKKVRLPKNKATAPIYRIGSLLKRFLKWVFPNYLINSWREVRQVTWPTGRETFRLVIAVVIFAVIVGLMVYGVDKVLDAIFKKVILNQ